MKKLWTAVALLIALSMLVASACSGGGATPAPTQAPTAAPTASPTPVPTAAPTGAPSATSTPAPAATSTPVRTSAPQTTATPVPTSAPAASPTPRPKPVTLKLTHWWLATHTGGLFAQDLADLVKEYTDGRVNVEVFPASMLVSATDIFDAASKGIVDMAIMDDWQMQGAGFMDWQIYMFPYLFQTWDQHEAFYNHPDGGQKLLKQIEPRGVKTLGIAPSFYVSVILTHKPYNSLFESKGLRMRTVPGMYGAFWAYFEAAGVSIPAADATSAWEQGIVTAFAGTVDTAPLYKPEYSLLYDHMTSNTKTVIVNTSKWNTIPADVQDIIVKRAIPDATKKNNDRFVQYNMDQIKKLIAGGSKVTWQTRAEMDKIEKAMMESPDSPIAQYIKQTNADLVKLAISLARPATKIPEMRDVARKQNLGTFQD